ncbi:glycosyltransferase family 4 protein [Clostridium pasteurianum]|uniref:glycosyltransferase family 4 protein n=1 Tax=Clostridium pasteurianum TaxID=1501 RepID=UPI0008DBAC25|nr:glycosyltransferase family 1 protein [Clostridium pasteurianum]AOZ81048.1 glycosyl transferase [Clostridium pasteurianum]
MRIGIDARAAKLYRGTGIGTYTYQLINCLNKIDTINDYLLFMPEASNIDINFSNKFKINNINEKTNNNFWDQVNIPNILNNKSIELYHVPQNGVGLPLEKTCPFIITLHDVIPYKMPDTVSDRYLHIFNEELPSIVSICDAIITVSNFSKNDIAKTFNFPANKIYVTYLAAENIYRPLNKELSKKIIKNTYGITGDFILYVGGFSPRKNIIGLLHAFKKLIAKTPNDLKLVIAGTKGKSYKNYKSCAQKLHIEDKVTFPGFIPINYMPYLYNSAKLFAYLSLYEGFGLPPVEAMACGVPVVSSNVTSLPEILNNCSLLVDPRDEDKICDALYKGLNDENLRKNLIHKGLSISKNFIWENTALSTLNIYKKVFKNT